MKNGLWTKDFSLITIGTVLSAIGGEAINLPLSLTVFSETKSTLLSAIVLILGLLPDTFLPIFIAPIIDNSCKKVLVVALDFILAVVLLIFGIIINFYGFNYFIYLTFAFITGCISVIYRLAYGAWYPDLIPIGYEQQGFAVSTTLYPTVMLAMSPLAAFLYSYTTMSVILYMVAALLFLSSFIELFITKDTPQVSGNVHNSKIEKYFSEIKAGYQFIKEEVGIRNIYIYRSLVNGQCYGKDLMVQALFQTSPLFTPLLFGVLKSAETVGRMIGGIFQYKIKIAPEKRFETTVKVYTLMNTLDMCLLFLPYPLMLINKFFNGFAGSTSLNITKTAVQSYLPAEMRAKVIAIFMLLISSTMIIFQLLVGILGEFIAYRKIVVALSLFGLLLVYLLIVKPKEVNQKVYQAVRENE